MGKERVLITGASGFIGGFLVEEALNNDLEVLAAVRKSSDISSLKNLNVEIVEIDFESITDMTKLFKTCNCTYVIHNAGLTKTKLLADYVKVNSQYLKNMVTAIKQSGIELKKLLYVSSLASYGPADFHPGGILKEGNTPHPVTDYGRSKLAAEQYLQREADIPYIIIRPTAVYGPKEKDLLNVFVMINKRLDMQIGYLPQKLTFIYVKDLSKLMVAALTSSHTNKGYFATDGHTYTGQALSGFIKEALNKNAIKIKLPIIALKGIAFASEKISGLFGNYPPLNIDKVHELKARNWSCDVDNLKTELGFTSEFDLSTGIPETVAWYKANNWL